MEKRLQFMQETQNLQKQIEQGLSAKEIRKTWTKGLEAFKKIREQYLLYE